MIIRKFTYTIGHIHILTFKDRIKEIIAPFFRYEPLEYGVDNEGTLQENVRLIFRKEGCIMQFNKESASLIYEGDIAEVKKHNPTVEIFFDIYDKITKMQGFIGVRTQNLQVDAVLIKEESEYKETLAKNNFLTIPFKNVDEFATIFEFKDAGKEYRVHFGNFTPKDIVKLNLTPLKLKFNEELEGKFGLVGQFQVGEETKSVSFSKLKDLIALNEKFIKEYNAVS